MLNPIINKAVNNTFTATTTKLVQIDYKQGGQNAKTDNKPKNLHTSLCIS